MDQIQKTGDEHSCDICLKSIDVYDLTCLNQNCRHEFHDECIKRWIKNHTDCPKCRTTWTNIDCWDVIKQLILLDEVKENP